MEFRQIFRQFIEHRQHIKAIFVGSSDEAGQPNCTPKLLVDITEPDKVYYIDSKSTQNYSNIQANWLTSLSFMDERTFTGYRLNGYSQLIDSGREFVLAQQAWSQKVIAYQAERMIERIKGIFSGYASEITLPEDFVIIKFSAESATIVKPNRILYSIRKAKERAIHQVNTHSIGKVATLQARIAELEKTEIRHRKAERELKTSRDFLQGTIDGVVDPLVVIDRSRRVVMANKSAREKADHGAGTIIGMPCHLVLHGLQEPCGSNEYDCPFKKILETRSPQMVTHLHQDANGNTSYVEVTSTPVFDESGEVIQIVKTCHDITERLLAEQKLEEKQKTLEKAVLEDDLTGLYNRRGFNLLAGQQLKVARREKQNLFLLFADLDNLKHINDKWGHEAGDYALVDSAHLLKQTFRDSDILARIGGDEFAVMMVGCIAELPQMMLDRIKKNIEQHHKNSPSAYSAALSIGIASRRGDETIDLETLMQRADRSMYEDKQRKRQQICPSINSL